MQPKDMSLTLLNGTEVNINDYQNKLWLIVNTASECGFTPQYQELQQLHEQYHEQGLVIMGFPCNQFMRQEPDDAKAIGAFCDSHYQITFPMFAKTLVNGPNAHPLYQWLKGHAPGVMGSRAVKWNFTKFLVSPDGQVRRYAPRTKPSRLKSVIEQLLPGH
ncbi:glutathione peroxidase [Gallaecimonas sp. GXIMD1310]|uniref:glutathione peroxidase n=1 Tax=Gallaecimonas sp. GXIMD1310 TaxID=3131926 RepID=UPI0032484AC7